MKPFNNPQTEPGEQVTSATDASFADILSQFEHEHHRQGGQGERVEGTVVAITADFVVVNIGRKSDGVIPLFTLQDQEGKLLVKLGDTVLVDVTGRNEEGFYELSTIKVDRPKDWSGLEAAFAEKRIIGGVVTETVKGGLRVDVGSRAFLPASRSGARDAAEMEKLIGQEIRVRITKLDTATEDVVVDRRGVLEDEEKAARDTAFEGVHEGQNCKGTVRSLMDFGAFLNIAPGVDGLLHVTDISWHRIAKPSDVLKVGDQIEVKVLKINRDTKKISLGMKQLQPDPWTLASTKFHVGDRVNGIVSRLTDFGAFVTLEPGVDGLIHISEMSWTKKVRKPSDAVSGGDQVDVVILGINASEHRISLGLKQALGDPWESAEKRLLPGIMVEGPITSMTNFGAFVDLGDGLEGMIHVGDITREKRLDHPKQVLKQGQMVKASVLEVDRDKRRIRLGMKQLEPTSADEYISEHQPGETVTGRVVEVKPETVKVELGDGVFAICKVRIQEAQDASATMDAERADLSSMTAMLTAKWKQGGAEKKGGRESAPPARAGEVRTFRILSLDAEQKKIQLELA